MPDHHTSAASPLATVIVVCYNQAAFVRDAIASVREQTYPNVELIAIDDASTDESAAMIEALRAGGDFTFVRNEVNQGLSRTLARALTLASGEYVSLLAADDLIEPTKLAREMGFLLDSGYDGVFATGMTLSPDGTRARIERDRLPRMFEDGSILAHVYTNDSYGPLIQSGLFRTSMLHALSWIWRTFESDDWALTIKMLEEYRIGFLNEPLFVYRLHDANAHRNYWRTLPMRLRVVCSLTPLPLRARALANVFASHASYLRNDGQYADAVRFGVMAFVNRPRVAQLVTIGKDVARLLGVRRGGG